MTANYSNSLYSYSGYSRYISNHYWDDDEDYVKSAKSDSEKRIDKIEKEDSYYEPYEGYSLEDIDTVSSLVLLDKGDKIDFDSGYIYEVGNSTDDLWVYDKDAKQVYFVYEGYLTFYDYGIAYKNDEEIE